MHFKGDLSSTADTVFVVDIDGTRSDYAATDTYGRNNVWSDYEIISHLDSTSSAIDATGHGNTGATHGSMSVVSAPTGSGLDLSATGYVDYGNAGNMLTGDMSISIWFKSTDSDGGAPIAKSYYSGSPSRYWITLRPGTNSGNLGYDGGVAGNNQFDCPYLDGNWHLIHGVYDRSATSRVYVDGVFISSQGISGGSSYNFNNPNSLLLGVYPTPGGGAFNHKSNLNFEAVLSEFRNIRSAVSADWISTEYANQNSPSAFYTVTPQSAPMAGIKVWDGTTWAEKPVKVWDGSQWTQKSVKRWDGSNWI